MSPILLAFEQKIILIIPHILDSKIIETRVVILGLMAN